MRLLLVSDPPLPGAENMRRDAALLAGRRPGDDPVLRLYRWAPPAVSLGRNQDPADFDLAAAAARGWQVVRRPTGGRAILHAEELTYAVAADSPSPLFGASLHTCYAAINRALLRFLAGLGLTAEVSEGEPAAARRGPTCFRSAGQHEIRVGGRKLVGSAQRRAGGCFLQHGSILTGPAHAALAELLAGRRAAAPDRSQLLAATTDLGALLGRPPAEPDLAGLQRRLADAFTSALGLEPAPVAWADLPLRPRTGPAPA